LSTIEIFYSYAHKDEILREELEKQLSLLELQGMITGWHDRRIGAGQEWADEINTHLNTANVILLLISPDFMASKYCYGIEVKRAIERHEQGDELVIPIILRPVNWKGAPFGKLQALPTDAIAVTSSKWQDLDEAFFNVAEGIRVAIEKLLSRNEAKQWRRQGDTHFEQNHFDEAFAAYEQAIRLDPKYAPAYSSKGNAFSRLHRFQEALEAYEQAIRLDPYLASAYTMKGNALSGLHRFQEALEACEQAIRLDPNLASAYTMKGYILNCLNRDKEAQQALEIARQLGGSG
jgi:tetratricopeptide (TPR) repeat protein